MIQFYRPDIADKVYIVTGGGNGLGLETARVLLFEGHATVIIAVRDMERGNLVANDWTQQYNAATNSRGRGRVLCQKLDLSSLQSVRDFANGFLQSGRILEGLCNNAGIFQVDGATADGFQKVWQTNYLSHALLTELLLPATSTSFRVVNVSSKLHFMAGGAGPLNLIIPPCKEAGGSYFDYSLSKACQVSHAMELNRKFEKETIDTKSQTRRMAFAVEPGLVNTGIMRESSSFVRYLNYILLAPILKTVGQGVSSSVFCLVANFNSGSARIEGGYYEDCAKVDVAQFCNDIVDAQNLDKKFREIVGL